MAQAIPLQTVALTGLTSTPVAGVAGDYIQNNGEHKGRIFLLCKNGATVADVTFTSVTDCDQEANHDVVHTATANETTMVGPFSPTRFNDGDGRVQLTYSNVTTITVEAVVVPLA